MTEKTCKHECPICGKTWESKNRGILLICENCYLTPMMFAVMNSKLVDSGLGLLKRSQQ